ncbi:MAG: redoxin domain-containing protein, partial [Thermoanaerobaculia bacterium]
KAALEALDVQVLAVSDDRPEKNLKLLEGPEKDALPFLLLSDSDRKAARLYRAHDDFEDLPLHATIFIDRAGKIRWSRSGAEPFRDVGFLKAEIGRVDRLLMPAKGRTLGL